MTRISFSLGSLLSVPDIQYCVTRLAKKEPDTIWIPETWGAENFSMLSMAAAKTSSAMIGSSIINVYSRSPALIAMGALTIDAISQGRMIIGLGTSSPPIVEGLHGQKFEDPLDRVRRYVQIIRMASSGKPINYSDKHYDLKGFTLLSKPYRAQIPIYLAAINPRMVDLTWDIADGVIFYLRPQKEIKETIHKMRATKKRRIDVTSQIITAVSDDSEKAIRRAKKTLAFYIAVGKIYRDFLAKNGYAHETAEIHNEYKRSGLKNNLDEYISNSMIQDLAICGTPTQAVQQLKKFKATGIDLPIIQFNPVGNVRDSFNMLQETFTDVSL